jgi:hypothetical protein
MSMASRQVWFLGDGATVKKKALSVGNLALAKQPNWLLKFTTNVVTSFCRPSPSAIFYPNCESFHWHDNGMKNDFYIPMDAVTLFLTWSTSSTTNLSPRKGRELQTKVLN